MHAVGEGVKHKHVGSVVWILTKLRFMAQQKK